LDEVIETDYGQFDLLWDDGYGFDGDFDRVFARQVNGLAGAGSGQGLYLNLARRSGGSPVRIALLEDTPPASATDGWEDIVEVAITIPHDAEPAWRTWAGQKSGPLDIPPGSYRVRVSARGRDAGAVGEFADGPVDFYLLEHARRVMLIEPADDERVLRFRHNLTRRAIVGRLLPHDRAARSARAAAAVKAAHPGLPGAWCELAAGLHDAADDHGSAAALMLEAGRPRPCRGRGGHGCGAAGCRPRAGRPAARRRRERA
jgi:hypothetical protein